MAFSYDMSYQPLTHISVSGWYDIWYEKLHIIIYKYLHGGVVVIWVHTILVGIETSTVSITVVGKMWVWRIVTVVTCHFN
jgi:hypothetical protein